MCLTGQAVNQDVRRSSSAAETDDDDGCQLPGVTLDQTAIGEKGRAVLTSLRVGVRQS